MKKNVISFVSCESFFEGIGSSNASMYLSSACRLMSRTIFLQMAFLSVYYNHTKITLYHRMDIADKYMVVDLQDAIFTTLIECAAKANAESAMSFLFNENTQQCVVESENAVQLSIPHGFDRFIVHQGGMF